MSPEEEQQRLREYVQRWKWLGPELERIRLSELRHVDTAQALANLRPLFALAAERPPRPGSGLVDQQELFKKLHKSN